jgi:hypothetical protein
MTATLGAPLNRAETLCHVIATEVPRLQGVAHLCAGWRDLAPHFTDRWCTGGSASRSSSTAPRRGCESRSRSNGRTAPKRSAGPWKRQLPTRPPRSRRPGRVGFTSPSATCIFHHRDRVPDGALLQWRHEIASHPSSSTKPVSTTFCLVIIAIRSGAFPGCWTVVFRCGCLFQLAVIAVVPPGRDFGEQPQPFGFEGPRRLRCSDCRIDGCCFWSRCHRRVRRWRTAIRTLTESSRVLSRMGAAGSGRIPARTGENGRFCLSGCPGRRRGGDAAGAGGAGRKLCHPLL